jgi:hypothetical protein
VLPSLLFPSSPLRVCPQAGLHWRGRGAGHEHCHRLPAAVGGGAPCLSACLPASALTQVLPAAATRAPCWSDQHGWHAREPTRTSTPHLLLYSWLRWRGAKPAVELTIVLAVAYLSFYVGQSPAHVSREICFPRRCWRRCWCRRAGSCMQPPWHQHLMFSYIVALFHTGSFMCIGMPAPNSVVVFGHRLVVLNLCFICPLQHAGFGRDQRGGVWAVGKLHQQVGHAGVHRRKRRL